jgi:hypothetical protein
MHNAQPRLAIALATVDSKPSNRRRRVGPQVEETNRLVEAAAVHVNHPNREALGTSWITKKESKISRMPA